MAPRNKSKTIASFDDGDVAAMRIGASRELGLEALVGLAVVEPGHTVVPCLDLHQHLRQIAVRSRSSDQRHVWRALENLVAFLLRHAAEHTKLLALRLKFLVVGEPVE